MTCANPPSSPNSTLKYGRPLGIDTRSPFFLVSTNFTFCAHSVSDSNMAFCLQENKLDLLEVNDVNLTHTQSICSNYVLRLLLPGAAGFQSDSRFIIVR